MLLSSLSPRQFSFLNLQPFRHNSIRAPSEQAFHRANSRINGGLASSPTTGGCVLTSHFIRRRGCTGAAGNTEPRQMLRDLASDRSAVV
jgi:hypothetical protein